MSTMAAKPLPMKEADLQAAVLDTAKLLGWRVMHQRPARTKDGWRTAIEGDAGFPDLVLLRPPRLVIAELKSAKGKVSPEQQLWLAAFREVGEIEVYEWRPDDWACGAIEAILR
jgi:hypothetical protein